MGIFTTSVRGIKKGNRRKFGLFLLLAGYIIVTPNISVVPCLEPYNERRLLQIGFSLTIGTSLLVSRRARSQWMLTFQSLQSIARWALGGVVGLGILSSALAPAPFYAFLELSHFGLLFVAGGVVASAVRSTGEHVEWVLLGSVVLSALLYAVRFFVGYGAALSLPELELGRETITGFQNVRFFNQYQTWTLPLLGAGVLALPKRWRVGRGIVLVVAALWWTLILASNVRGTVVAMAVAAIGAWLLFRGASYRWLTVQGAALLMGGGLYHMLFTLPSGTTLEVVDRLSEVGQSRRLQHWKKCLRVAWQHPMLGAGPMHFASAPFDFTRTAHLHNAFMQWLAEWGMPSTGIMSGLAIWGGGSWVQQEQDGTEQSPPSGNATRVGDAVRVVLLTAVLAGTAHAMVSGLLVMPLSQVLLVLVAGWAWGRYQRSNKDRNISEGENISGRAHVALCAVLVASMVAVGTSLRDLSATEERHSAFFEKVDRDVFSPQYWTQGYIGVRDLDATETFQQE